MGIEVQRVGHVVLKVTDIERALVFYLDALGLNEVARHDFGDGPMAFLSSGHTHHDVRLVEVGDGVRRPLGDDVGLYHVALKIGDDLDTLRAAQAHLHACGVAIQWIGDHGVSQSIYISDPDGNNVELYVDADPAIWQDDPAAVATATDLHL